MVIIFDSRLNFKRGLDVGVQRVSLAAGREIVPSPDAMNHSVRAPGGTDPCVSAPPHRPNLTILSAGGHTFIWIRISLFAVQSAANRKPLSKTPPIFMLLSLCSGHS